MRLSSRCLRTMLLVGTICGVGGSSVALESGQSPPIRLASIGDSLTRAVNANLPGDNLNNSWVNGYYGFWQRLLGLPNVHSHNQRIADLFGSTNNWIAAENGARIDDMASQAAAVVTVSPTYVTSLLGSNDVCRDTPAELPTDEEFAAHFRAGMTTLLNGLADGATVLVVAIPNIKALYDLGLAKTALGITSCPRLWRLTGTCQAMLSRRNTALDREYVQSRNVGYNAILQQVTGEMAASYPGKFVRFAAEAYQLPFAEEQISDIDCYHASWRGQKVLSELTWPNF